MAIFYTECSTKDAESIAMTVPLEYIMMTALLEYLDLFSNQVAEKWSGQSCPARG